LTYVLVLLTIAPCRSAGTKDDYFRFDIMVGLMKARLRGVRRLFTEEERERIARTIVDHLRLSRSRWWRGERSVDPGYMGRMGARDMPPDDGDK
jgi:hypothetical protein